MYKKNTWLKLVLSLFIVYSSWASAGVIIDGTRVIFPGKSKEVTVKLTNLGSKPVLVQSWLDNGKPDVPPEEITTPFIITPPINRINAGKGQNLRISIKSAALLNQNMESLWWLNVLEIPAKPQNIKDENNNYLQLAIRTRVKFIYRPDTLSKINTYDNIKGLKMASIDRSLVIKNPTPLYISISSITVNGKKYEAPMLSPDSTITLKNIDVIAGQIIDVTWIDDYGAFRENKFTVN